MEIINCTHFRDDHLRALIIPVVDEELELEPEKRRQLSIEVKHGRQVGRTEDEIERREKEGIPICWELLRSGHRPGFGTSGLAGIGVPWIVLRMPKRYVDKVDFVRTLAHELAHVRGMKHRQMNQTVKYGQRETPGHYDSFLWAEDLPLELKEQAVAASDSGEAKAERKKRRREQKLQHMQEQVKRWTRRAKLAQTKLRKYKTKLKRISDG